MSTAPRRRPHGRRPPRFAENHVPQCLSRGGNASIARDSELYLGSLPKLCGLRLRLVSRDTRYGTCCFVSLHGR